MGKEIERKFLFDPGAAPELGRGEKISQAYIATADEVVVRIRIKGDAAYLTLKGKTTGSTRTEFEYPIPVADAESIIDELCSGPLIEKTRYEIQYAQHVWELDIFHGENEGLCIAEVELNHEHETVNLPTWVGREVTGDPRYYNNNLLTMPYRVWRE